MKIEIIPAFEHAAGYIADVSGGGDRAAAWGAHMIGPHWDRLAQWAPFDIGFMKPEPIDDIASLGEQLRLLARLDTGRLREQFSAIAVALPMEGNDDPLLVGLYPLDHGNAIVRERQNGVVGACVFGNILININPLAQSWIDWIPYVFAHEYHHCAWGHHWYAKKGGAGLSGDLLERIITEGQADAFAKRSFPGLRPQWLERPAPDAEGALWERFLPVLHSTDSAVIDRFIFGGGGEGLPWCIGYRFGAKITEGFSERHPQTSFQALLEMSPADILAGSGLKADRQGAAQ